MTSRFYPIGLSKRNREPARAHSGDAGYDLFSPVDMTIRPGGVYPVLTGYGVRLKPGEVAMVCPRSGLALAGATVVNAPGIIDSGYTGEIIVMLAALVEPVTIVKGQAVAQLVIMKYQDIEDNDNHRGEKGFGSSG